jgi:branched-chain amino acid transport system substrate-binding protein
MISAALKKGEATTENIRSGIEKQHKLIGVSGVFSMSDKDHNGLDLSAFEMVKISKGDWLIAH